MSEILQMLLGGGDLLRNAPTAEVEITRLSTDKEKFIVTLKALPFDKAVQLQQVAGDEADLQVILASAVEPDFRAPELLDPAKGIATAEDVLKHYLLPGEIRRLVMAVDTLNGYRGASVVEIKN